MPRRTILVPSRSLSICASSLVGERGTGPPLGRSHDQRMRMLQQASRSAPQSADFSRTNRVVAAAATNIGFRTGGLGDPARSPDLLPSCDPGRARDIVRPTRPRKTGSLPSPNRHREGAALRRVLSHRASPADSSCSALWTAWIQLRSVTFLVPSRKPISPPASSLLTASPLSIRRKHSSSKALLDHSFEEVFLWHVSCVSRQRRH